MSAKKKTPENPILERLKPLWQKYSPYVCGVLLLLLVVFALLMFSAGQKNAAAAETARAVIEKIGAGTACNVQIISHAENNALLEIRSDRTELNGVLLHYTPEGISRHEIDRIVIRSVRSEDDIATVCRQLYPVLNGGEVKCVGTITIGEFFCGGLRYENLELTPDQNRSGVYVKGKMNGAELELDFGKKQLRVTGDFACRLSLLPALSGNGDAGSLLTGLWTMMQKDEPGSGSVPVTMDQVVFHAQELQLSLAEDVPLLQRVIKLRADGFLQYDSATGDLLCTWQGNTFKAKLDAATGTTDFELHAPTNRNRVYQGRIQPDGTITGKGSASGEASLLNGTATRMTVEYGDGFNVLRVTATDYRETLPAFTFTAPHYVSRPDGGIEFKGGTMAFAGTDITAGDVAVTMGPAQTGKGTFTLGTVSEKGRTIGSISGTVDGGKLSGKVTLYGLDGTLTGRLTRDGKILEYTLSFPRQQIKNAGRDLLPENTAVRLQGFATLKMDHTGTFDLVIDNGELDLGAIRLSNFGFDRKNGTFSFAGADCCGIQFGKGKGRCHMENGRFVLDGVSFDWCGGSCTLLPQLEKGAFQIDCSDLLLADLFREWKIGTFTGDGRVSGKFPLKIAENGAVTLLPGRLFSAPGSRSVIEGKLNEISGDRKISDDLELVRSVMQNMVYNWIRVDFIPDATAKNLEIKISFSGKPREALPFEYVRGDGGMTLRKSEKLTRLGFMNCELNLPPWNMEGLSKALMQ